jgi:hypothetical protein
MAETPDPAGKCFASWDSPPHAFDCELPAGHPGEHQVTISWEEDPKPALPVHRVLEDMTGYDYYLVAKYSGTTLTQAGADLSTIDPSLRCPDLRCALPVGHSGLHEDDTSRWTQPIPLQRGPFDVR